MFKSYIKSAIRNISKQKLYSIISISGIIIGMGIFIFMWFIFNFYNSADKFHENADRLYSIVQILKSENGEMNQTAITPTPLLEAMLEEFPSIESGTRFFPADRLVIRNEIDNFYENNVLFVDPNFLNVFSFKLLKGNPESVLNKPNAMVISESAADKYFGKENPIGRQLNLNNKIDVVITGIVEDEPLNSSINYNFMVSMSTAQQMYDGMDDWAVLRQATYLLLPENYNKKLLEEKFPAFIKKYYADATDSPESFYLLPLADFMKSTTGIDTHQDKIFPVVIYLLMASGIILLVIGCFNFISLSTARHLVRSKEIGLRKVVGASRLNLIMQFMTESLLLTLVSLPGAMIVFELVQAYFIQFTNFPLFSIWENPNNFIIVFIITISIGLLAGSYPAIFLSSLQPVKTIKNSMTTGKKGTGIRKILVVSQFALSIILIVFAIIVNLQFNHILNTDMGYNRDQVLAVSIPAEKRAQISLLQNEFAKHSGISSISASSALPCAWDNKVQAVPQDFAPHESKTVNAYGVDYQFIELFQLNVLQGRGFSKSRNDESGIIINKTAAKQFHWDNPIGKEITFNKRTGKVIGIVDDFLFKDVHYNIIPAILYLSPDNLNYILVKTTSNENIQEVSAYLENTWISTVPDLPFEVINHNDYFFNIYKGINTIAHLCGFVGIIGILFSCLGIFALATYTVERKYKEIGIRKVMGASETSILSSLLKSFMKFVIWANIIGLPISYLISNHFITWGFTYRINISWSVFIFVSFISIFLSVISISWQVLRAASANPVEILKYE